MTRLLVLVAALAAPCACLAAVDTLWDTTDILDGVIYSYTDCNAEAFGENCRRYNGGGVYHLAAGKSSSVKEKRALFQMPGWDGEIPDSAEFRLYIYTESDSLDRRLFLHPVIRAFWMGEEASYGLGNYPDPDSGATWLHAHLDVGDADSVLWTAEGGDYTAAVACTATVSKTGAYASFRGFNRILQYWDTSRTDFGFIVINENAAPADKSSKAFKSSEAGTGLAPLAILYTTDAPSSVRRRQTVTALGRL